MISFESGCISLPRDDGSCKQDIWIEKHINTDENVQQQHRSQTRFSRAWPGAKRARSAAFCTGRNSLVKRAKFTSSRQRIWSKGLCRGRGEKDDESEKRKTRFANCTACLGNFTGWLWISLSELESTLPLSAQIPSTPFPSRN